LIAIAAGVDLPTVSLLAAIERLLVSAWLSSKDPPAGWELPELRLCLRSKNGV